MMRDTVAIRPMTTADIPAVLAIQAVCYTELVPESLASLHAKLHASPSTCFVAAVGSEATGYLIALPWTAASPPELDATSCRLPDSPDCLYLHDLAVLPEVRRFGVGRALVDAFFAELSRLALARAGLVAVQDSVGYWARYGFRVVEPTAQLKAKLATYGEGVAYMELHAAKTP